MTVPEVGWHDDAPMDDYLAWPVTSASLAMLLTHLKRRTPAYFRWALLSENGAYEEASAAARLGDLSHSAILEPATLDERYVVEPEPDPEVFRTKGGKPSKNPRATEEFKAAVRALGETGKRVVSAEAWAAAIEIRDRVRANRRAAQLLDADGPIERSGVVADPETGVLLKIRPDKLVAGIGANVNLKTTTNADPDPFGRDVYRYGYFFSAAFYRIALAALDFEARHSILLAVETEGPKEVNVVELDEGALDAGEQLVRLALRRLADCFERDEWPGHPQEITSVTLPHFAWQRVDEELAGYGG